MYLSKLILNVRNRSVQRDLSDCQSMHRTIMAAFPGRSRQAPRSEWGVLYRVDGSQTRRQTSVLIQSGVKPDWSQLPEGYTLGEPAVKPVGDQYAQIREGRVLHFRLLANPTRKIKTKSGPNGEKRNGQRVELLGEEDQLAWLDRKAEDAGFQPLDVQIVGKGRAYEALGHHPAGALTLKGVEFEGRLVVRDQPRFVQALQHLSLIHI